MNRRDFVISASQAAALACVAGAAQPKESLGAPLKVSVFSKHLQFLNWEEMAQTAAAIGFDGIDLTVREGGHVLPERVEHDLPKAAEIIRAAEPVYQDQPPRPS